MRRSIIYSAVLTAFLGLSAAASAQNLDPTVVVSRNYEGKLMEVHKPKIEMAVPDSVLRFDLEFDYSVSDSKYRGAYEFKPYLVDMTPAPVQRERERLYLRAGAGYGLHPELDLVWTPELSAGSFSMGAYASNRSYFGRYWHIDPKENAGVMLFERRDEPGWNGYDSRSKAGFNGRYDWDNGLVRFDLGYDGLHQDGIGFQRAYDAGVLKVNMASKDAPYSDFNYDFDAMYRFGNERIAISSLSENVFALDGAVSYPLSARDKVRLDLAYDLASYAGTFDAQAALLSLAPHYVMDFGRLDLDLGVSFAAVFNAKNEDGMFSYKRMGLTPYLDMKADYDLVPSYLNVYLALGGGTKMNAYASVLDEFRWSCFNKNTGIGVGMLDFIDEKFSSVIGAEGRISRYFTYGFKGGYASVGNAPLTSVIPYESYWVPVVVYTSYDKAFATLEWEFRNERISFDGDVEYTYVWKLADDAGVFAPVAVTGDVSFEYNWMKRIFAGVSCSYATARKGYLPVYSNAQALAEAKVPGYADLGVNFEYAFSPRFSLWAKGSNLLNMTIQRTPLYAEKGPCVTLGIGLNL